MSTRKCGEQSALTNERLGTNALVPVKSSTIVA